ncbi:MAG: hypothetical protein LBH63_00060, partial [Clostridiales Family XIII bacterium]|nr:hypothetical protein [Clostridiales Family XIII bacterium]
MNILQKLPKILEDAEELWQRTIPANLSFDAVFDAYAGVKTGREGNLLIAGDNLAAAKTLLAGIRAGTRAPIDLIYMDPPFFTKSDYASVFRLEDGAGRSMDIPLSAFSDTWQDTTGSRDDGFAH